LRFQVALPASVTLDARNRRRTESHREIFMNRWQQKRATKSSRFGLKDRLQ
jgi:hypothetical protein